MRNSAVRIGFTAASDVSGGTGPSRRVLGSNSSNRSVSEAFADSLRARSERQRGVGSFAAVSQETGTDSSSGQKSVTTKGGVSGWSIFGGNTGANTAPTRSTDRTKTPATAGASGAVTGAPVYATRAEADAAIVKSLQDALAAAGINTAGLGLAAHEDVVTYPGGSYINRYISVNTNGHVAGLMTDLVSINPKIAVLDIKRMLGMATG
jgi:hypothetical protein